MTDKFYADMLKTTILGRLTSDSPGPSLVRLKRLEGIDNPKPRILDVVADRVSAKVIMDLFPNAHLKCIVHPDDARKHDIIRETVDELYKREYANTEIVVLEKDIFRRAIDGKYDVILANMVFTEMEKYGHSIENILGRLLNADFKYLVVVDWWENPNINWRYIDNFLSTYFKDNCNYRYTRISGLEDIPKEQQHTITTFKGKLIEYYIIEKIPKETQHENGGDKQ